MNNTTTYMIGYTGKVNGKTPQAVGLGRQVNGTTLYGIKQFQQVNDRITQAVVWDEGVTQKSLGGRLG